MPIYEFYCRHCHRVMSFLSRAVNTETTPACPRCGKADLARRASAFAISKGRKEAPKPETPPGPDIDEARLEKAMEALAGDMDSIDENDPKQGAHLMRKLFSATGMPVAGGMEEALRRMEAGEDPEKIEEEMGDVFEEDPARGPRRTPTRARGTSGACGGCCRRPTTPSCTSSSRRPRRGRARRSSAPRAARSHG
jgi:putative FmdB family regulatory protein